MGKYRVAYSAANESAANGKGKAYAAYNVAGVLLILFGVFLVVAIALFYLQSTNPPSHIDFVTAIVGIELQLVGFALIALKRK